MPPDRIALLVATAFFLGGLAHAVQALHRGTYRSGGAAFLLLLGGFVCQCLFLTWRGRELGSCPMSTPLERLTFISWAMVLLYFIVGPAYRLSLLGAFTAPLALVIQIAALLQPKEAVTNRGSHGFWPELHAALSLVAYGAFALAFVAGVMFLVQDRLLKKHTGMKLVRNLPPIHHLTRAIQRLILTGTIILTAGIVSAYQMEKRPAADKLVFVWVVWAAYVALLLYELSRGMSARRAAWAAAGCFVLAVVSLWFVAPR